MSTIALGRGMAFDGGNEPRRTIDALAASPALAVAARALTVVVSLVAIPYIGWTVSSIYESTRRLAVVEGQVNDLRTVIGTTYRQSDATRDLEATKIRLEALDHRADRLETRIDGLQGDLASIQRASAAPVGKK